MYLLADITTNGIANIKYVKKNATTEKPPSRYSLKKTSLSTGKTAMQFNMPIKASADSPEILSKRSNMISKSP